jgi:hypothetical protein
MARAASISTWHDLRLAVASPVSMTSDIDSPRTACRYYHNKLRCNTTRLATPIGVLPGTIDLAGCISKQTRSHKLAPFDLLDIVIGLSEQTCVPEIHVLQLIIS